MKTKLVIFCMLLLGFSLGVRAADGGCLVQCEPGFYPDTAAYGLTEISAKNGIYAADNPETLRDIAAHIEYTAPNGEVSLMATPADPLYSEQWQLSMIHADSGWAIETYGNGVKVAVIDSGCYPHTDLADNLLAGKNYLTGSSDTNDDHGHGTHVSGLIAAQINGTGMVGVAPKAQIVPLKCFDGNGKTQMSDLLQAIYDAVDVYDCQIINMSWGLPTDDSFLKEAVAYAAAHGAILIAAAGNYGGKELYYPAAYSQVIGVGSVGSDKTKSWFSQHNTSVFVAAPGEDVKSTYKDGDYAFLEGTSQAAPQISGLAAVALSADAGLTSADFRQLLAETAEDLGTPGYDTDFGYGLVNVQAFLDKLLADKVYTSPINQTAEGAYVLVKNNTSQALEAVSLFAYYEGSRFIGCKQTPVALQPGGEVMVTTEGGAGLSHLLWSSMQCLQPASNKREQ